jgi:hypothetical protein
MVGGRNIALDHLCTPLGVFEGFAALARPQARNDAITTAANTPIRTQMVHRGQLPGPRPPDGVPSGFNSFPLFLFDDGRSPWRRSGPGRRDASSRDRDPGAEAVGEAAGCSCSPCYAGSLDVARSSAQLSRPVVRPASAEHPPTGWPCDLALTMYRIGTGDGRVCGSVRGTGCAERAEVTLTYHYGRSQVWLDDLSSPSATPMPTTCAGATRARVSVPCGLVSRRPPIRSARAHRRLSSSAGARTPSDERAGLSAVRRLIAAGVTSDRRPIVIGQRGSGIIDGR